MILHWNTEGVQVMRLNYLFNKLACTFMVLALFLVTGGHMAVLQGVAWTMMIHDFSRTASLSQAVEKTLDGQHPCPLCKKIAKAHAAEEKSPVSVKVDKKAEVFVVQAGDEVPLPICQDFIFAPIVLQSLPEVFSAPPVPVPIGLLS